MFRSRYYAMFLASPFSAKSQVAVLIACLLCASCAVGPNFKKPAPPDVNAYTADPLPNTLASTDIVGGETQRLVNGADISGDWWTLFHSKALNDLIEQSLASNHDLKAAQAALTAAHENTVAAKGAYFPSITGSFSATRQSQSGSIAPTPSSNAFQYNLFTPQVSVAYVPDVFGLNRRTVESTKAQEQEVRYQMIASYIALSANVVTAAIQEASLQAQVDATQELIGINSKIAETLKYQFEKGYASGLDMAAQESQVAQINATLPPLLKQLAQQRDLLAVLAGRYPSQAPREKFELAGLQLPEELPVTLPSDLVRQRPDVLQAEENQHDASAKIGIAIANRLPNFAISADAGRTGLTLAQVFSPGAGFVNGGWWCEVFCAMGVGAHRGRVELPSEPCDSLHDDR